MTRMKSTHLSQYQHTVSISDHFHALLLFLSQYSVHFQVNESHMWKIEMPQSALVGRVRFGVAWQFERCHYRKYSGPENSLHSWILMSIDIYTGVLEDVTHFQVITLVCIYSVTYM